MDTLKLIAVAMALLFVIVCLGLLVAYFAVAIVADIRETLDEKFTKEGKRHE